MKKFFSLFLIFAIILPAAVLETGCTEALSDANIGKASSVLSAIETVVSVASVIFGDAKPLIPADHQDTAQNAFNTLVLNVEKAKTALADALSLAKDSKTRPDTRKLVDDAISAINDLQDFLKTLKTSKFGIKPNGEDDVSKVFETSKGILARSK